MSFRDLANGETAEAKGSAAKPYVMKNVGGVYSCSCIAWRNQSAPIDARTCKHLKALRGPDVEAQRVAHGAPAAKSDALVAAEGEAGRALRGDEKAALFGPKILLAMDWWEVRDDVDVTGWWMSEKLDGVRAYWDGHQFVSRQGNAYKAPSWFTEGLPAHPLDGELWMGRGKFQATVSIVRRADMPTDWKQIKYVTFDMPHVAAPFEERQAAMARAHDAYARPPNPAFWIRLEQILCDGEASMLAQLDRVKAIGGEGIMLRKPASMYEAGRSHTLLKVKQFQDAEAVVIGHTKGKGKHKGKLGALIVKMPGGETFNIGTGFSEASRKAPPPIGASITYRFTETTDGGIPKCASFVSVRDYE